MLSKNVALAKAVEEVKKSSSKWVKTQGAEFGDFHWQNGYGGFSVSQSSIDAVNLDNSRASCLKPLLTARKPCKATACTLKRDV